MLFLLQRAGAKQSASSCPPRDGLGGCPRRAPHSLWGGPCWLLPGLCWLLPWSHFPFGSGGSPEPLPASCWHPPESPRAPCAPPTFQVTEAQNHVGGAALPVLDLQRRDGAAPREDVQAQLVRLQLELLHRPCPRGQRPKRGATHRHHGAAGRAFCPGGTKALLRDPSAPKRGCDPPRLLPRPGIRQGPCQPQKGAPPDRKGDARQGRSGVSARNYALGTKGVAPRFPIRSRLPVSRVSGLGSRL